MAFDNALGGLADWGGGYTIRLGPWIIGAIVDEAAKYDIGATFRRPMEITDYRLTGRVTNGIYCSADGVRRYDTMTTWTIAALSATITGLAENPAEPSDVRSYDVQVRATRAQAVIRRGNLTPRIKETQGVCTPIGVEPGRRITAFDPLRTHHGFVKLTRLTPKSR